ncbi:hypothetical protein Lbir_2910 [Legionella birminghamensis]|uniref:Flagellar FliJ protein n=1 Tax=Legionella birminghamensis TaxID=28083 RepID=A0A378I727_9GAMM|nr:hypothetical protein [Legionella birminghamensis]KTC68308.1 hypothetical protein Lbir_2910 [Legionella birminghamensis]STX30979.1 Uncharacterised protein [Legionella birminghamensis]
MNLALSSLMNKLKKQIEALNNEQLTVREKIKTLEMEAVGIKAELAKALEIPAHIIPEQEISRLNFVIARQQQYDDLQMRAMDYEKLLAIFQERHLRLKTELKTLEKYRERNALKEKKAAESIAEKEMDTWALLKSSKKYS